MSLARLLPLEGQEKGAARRYQRRVVPDPFLEGRTSRRSSGCYRSRQPKGRSGEPDLALARGGDAVGFVS